MSVSNDVLVRQKPAPQGARRRRWLWPQWSGFQLSLLFGAGVVAALVLVVPVYLFVRTAGAAGESLDVLLRVSTLRVLGNTVLLAAAVTVAAIAIAVPVAWLTTATDLPGKRVWAVLAALPLVLPSYVAAFIYISIFSPKGLLQQSIAPWTGIERLPSIFGFPGAFLVLTLISYPYILLTVRAALKTMDPALAEAARSLGHSPWQAFRRVTLPYLRPSVVAGALLVMLYVMRDFGAVTLLQYSTFTRVIYNRYLSYRLDMAAALAIVLVVLTVLVLYLEYRSRGRARYARLSAGAARVAQPHRLGRWRIPALMFLGTVVFSSLLLPAGGLLYWFWRGWRQDYIVRDLGVAQTNLDTLTSLIEPAWHSVSASFLAAVAAMALALPVAILVVRRPGRLSHFFERLSYVGFALPGIVVALALVFFGTNVARPLYQTLPMLLAAYVILFIPQAVGAQRSALLQVSPSLEEAGRSLGEQPFQVLRRVTLPLVRSGLVAGGALVFLTCMKELPATLILSPLGFSTLASQIWTNVGEAFFARAALPTLLLLLLSSVPLALLTFRDRHGV